MEVGRAAGTGGIDLGAWASMDASIGFAPASCCVCCFVPLLDDDVVVVVMELGVPGAEEVLHCLFTC